MGFATGQMRHRLIDVCKVEVLDLGQDMVTLSKGQHLAQSLGAANG